MYDRFYLLWQGSARLYKVTKKKTVSARLELLEIDIVGKCMRSRLC